MKQSVSLLLVLAVVKQAQGQVQLLADGYNLVRIPQPINRNTTSNAGVPRQLTVHEGLPLVEDYTGIQVSSRVMPRHNTQSYWTKVLAHQPGLGQYIPFTTALD